MLTPYFGSSLYVLSSVLTTILAALSGGYYFGGKLADRAPFPSPLFVIIATAGTMMLFLFLLAEYLLPYSPYLFNPIVGPLICATVLFFLPALLLGIDSPYVIKLLTIDRPHDTGETVGLTFFWSTVGSITGSLLAGFYLIPYLGITTTITGASFILVAWSVIAHLIITAKDQAALVQKTQWYLYVILVIAAIVMYYILYRPVTTNDENMTNLYTADGFYSRLQVLQTNQGTTTYRILKNDNNFSSAIITGDTRLVFPYAQLADIYLDHGLTPKNYLVLGSGAYTIPRFIADTLPRTEIDVVDIEQRLLPLSYTYFELPRTERIRSHFVDARAFLQSTTTTYDVIFSDVMNGGHIIPQHLATKEFFTVLKERLAPEGIALVNIIATRNIGDDSLATAFEHTIASVFPNYRLIAIGGIESTMRQNLVYLLRHDTVPITINESRLITNYFTGTTTPITTITVPERVTVTDEAMVFTDDKAAVEPLMVKQELHEEKPRR
jgi:predicted membrane-bound spermidine synthase